MIKNLKIPIKKLIPGVEYKQLTRHNDGRGFFEELIRKTDSFFKEGFGQLSHSYMFPGVIKAWHIHKTQIDWWFVARGTLKVALCDLRKDLKNPFLINEFTMGEDGDDIVLKIPSGVAHGCKAVNKESELFYVTSSVYTPKEEGRIPHDDKKIGYDWMNL